ncbi:MAG: hypothetical protein DBY09_02370 [Selenomonadales bacterium]|nr:MAG: hypothetical protein DBY09_02370 [Selenomonadales bacterium]
MGVRGGAGQGCVRRPKAAWPGRQARPEQALLALTQPCPVSPASSKAGGWDAPPPRRGAKKPAPCAGGESFAFPTRAWRRGPAFQAGPPPFFIRLFPRLFQGQSRQLIFKISFSFSL